MEMKGLTVEVKDEAKGIVQARFATLGVKDHDGDVIEKGAFGEQDVRVSSFGHASWRGALPVGSGTIQEKKNEAVADMQFFMDTEIGREHFGVVKGLGPLGEWSFGFDVEEAAVPDEDQRQSGVRRVLKKLKVIEVSPVLQGAGVNTATLATKALGPAESEEVAERDRQWVAVLGDLVQQVAGESKDGAESEEKDGGEGESKGGGEPDALKEEIAREVARFEAIKIDMER